MKLKKLLKPIWWISGAYIYFADIESFGNRKLLTKETD